MSDKRYTHRNETDSSECYRTSHKKRRPKSPDYLMSHKIHSSHRHISRSRSRSRSPRYHNRHARERTPNSSSSRHHSYPKHKSRQERSRSPPYQTLPRRDRQCARYSPCDRHYGSTSPERIHAERKQLPVSKTEDIQDFCFPWDHHKYALNRIFFRDEDLIKRGTTDYDDLWGFIEKYQSFHKKKAANSALTHKPSCTSDDESELGVPRVYDKRHRVNITLPTREVDSVLKQCRPSRGATTTLTHSRVEEFERILLLYLDFRQKQKFSLLMKIRKDQQNLPIYQYKSQIIDTVKEYPVCVIAGDTGCGKSTQVPQYLLEAGYSMVACTQPRRIACISLSKRVAYETLNEYGTQVAYQVRFEKSRTQATRILFLTEGLLLRQMSSDPTLSKYNVIVIDEVHERHIHTDFLLGVLKALVQRRSDVKIVLMSATININLFSDYFETAPVVKVPGRLYPIQLEYQPISREEQSSRSERLDPMPYMRILQLIDHKYPSNERGDVLIFLSGLSEIMAVVEAGKDYAQKTKSWIILPLHSALSIAEQDKVFDIAPEGIRKCIVSTNIAETSVTIDGVRFVVDSGRAKEMSYDEKYKMQRLQEYWISRASAEQRKGRAGRTGPGVCYRLYEESQYDDLQRYSTPEILRVPLDGLVLQMIAMGLPNARKFPFIEPPSSSSLETSIAFLKEQSALDSKERLTSIGEMLANLPVDVVIGKMLIMASIFRMVDPVLTIAAALSVQSPFTSKAHTDYDAMRNRKSLESEEGDPFTLYNAFNGWIQEKSDGRATRKWCQRRGFEEQRFYEMSKLKRQFNELLRERGLLEDLGSRVDEDKGATSYERQQRNAERKHLRELRRDKRNTAVKRKVLKLEDQDFVISGDEETPDVHSREDLDSSIKDLEFRLTHNLDKLQEVSCGTLSVRECTMLKVILCSGLYPQVAIPDEHNSYKPSTEQIYHTKSKGFVVVHPTSLFAIQPELLELADKDVQKVGGIGRDFRTPLSTKHQLLSFVSLIETTKPYITGLMRVPALQTVTLYASQIDTNTDCTRLVCDSWLEFRFLESEVGERILSHVVELRSAWNKLIQAKLNSKSRSSDPAFDEAAVCIQIHRLEKLLAARLSEYLASEELYAMRQLLLAEQAKMYIGHQPASQSFKVSKLKSLVDEAEPHPVKGGLKVNDYLTVNCLRDDDMSSYGDYCSFLQKSWTCPNCAQILMVSVVEKLQHQQNCLCKQDNGNAASSSSTPQPTSYKKLGRDYHCDTCNQDLFLTATEILKHKKQCKLKE